MSAVLRFGPEICGDFSQAESREWLVTNGIGGYASGTIAGGMSRKYHGLLIAALRPPLGRMQLVAWIDEVASYQGAEFPLATHRWVSGAVEPKGFQHIEEFSLAGTTPVWRYALGEARLDKCVWMQRDQNTTYVRYKVTRASGAIELQLKALVNYRDFHGNTHAGEWRMELGQVPYGVRVLAFEGAIPFYVICRDASCEARHQWYRDCFLPWERARGLDDREDHLFAAEFRARLTLGQSVTVVLSTHHSPELDGEKALSQRASQDAEVLRDWDSANSKTIGHAPQWIRRLALAADQFIVKRQLPEEPDGRSVIAGYHWFGDWGRDTMIAMPGLTLATGRKEAARRILLAFARYVDRGMLPNNFPDTGGEPGYNTVDAGLWYFEAARQYLAATQDRAALEKLFPVLAEMIEAHVRGTRYDIHVDESDGLLYAGQAGVQLTWMDAKVGDWVVTPRTGKAVEINALWINALATMAGFARELGIAAARYEELSARAIASFTRFWNEQRGCCYDVIDAPGIRNDPSLRPNQIFAVALPVSPLTPEQRKRVVEICTEQLLTPYGLRSLAPGESGYQGHYEGEQRRRDAAYHQGTVWGWLLGPFAMAHYRVYGDRQGALRFFEPFRDAMGVYGVGTLGEVFDGDAPFTPGGCIAQAWTVAETLRVWMELSVVRDSRPSSTLNGTRVATGKMAI